jgi:hypothetical protein
MKRAEVAGPLHADVDIHLCPVKPPREREREEE